MPRRVYVGPLCYHVDEQAVANALSQYGHLSYFKVTKGKEHHLGDRRVQKLYAERHCFAAYATPEYFRCLSSIFLHAQKKNWEI